MVHAMSRKNAVMKYGSIVNIACLKSIVNIACLKGYVLYERLTMFYVDHMAKSSIQPRGKTQESKMLEAEMVSRD